MFLANPRVVDICEQQRIVYSVDGEARHYTCDFVVTWASGLRVAYEVKYAADADRKDTASLLLTVAQGCTDEVADEFQIITEKELDLATIENSVLVVACANDQDGQALDAVERWLGEASETVTLVEIERGTGLGSRARRAAVALIQAGRLTVPPGEVIHADLPLSNNGALRRAT